MLRSLRVVSASLLILMAPVAALASPEFMLTNRTGYAIDRVYVSHTSDRQWGQDVMATPSLSNGERASINLPSEQSQCQYDLRVEYHDGQKATWSGLNLCNIPKISLYWNNKTRMTTAQPE